MYALYQNYWHYIQSQISIHTLANTTTEMLYKILTRCRN